MDEANSEKILVEQIKRLTEQSYASIGGTMAALAAMIYVVFEHVQGWLLFWIVAILLVNVYKVHLLYRYSRAESADKIELTPWLKRWLSRYQGMAMAHGIAWGGFSAVVFFIGDPSHEFFTFYIIGGLAVGSIATTAAVFSIYISYVIPMLLPIIVLHLFRDDDVSVILVAIMSFFVLAIVSMASHHARSIKQAINLQFMNLDLIERVTEAKNRATEENEAKSRFLAHMSHEMRTPMNNILGYSRLLRSTELNQEQRSLVNTIHDASDGLLNVVNEVLDFSSVEAGKMTFKSEPVLVRDVVEQVVAQHSALAYEKGLELLVDIRPSTPSTIMADGFRLCQILTNLIGNAVKFTERGGVYVSVWAEPGPLNKPRLRIDVLDTGPGIPAEQRDALFHPFSQLEEFEERRHEGTGLGLAICNHMLRAMNGRVALEGNEGDGARFMVTLPIQSGVSGEMAMPSDLGKAVLVAGTPFAAEAIGHRLQALGYDIETVNPPWDEAPTGAELVVIVDDGKLPSDRPLPDSTSTLVLVNSLAETVMSDWKAKGADHVLSAAAPLHRLQELLVSSREEDVDDRPSKAPEPNRPASVGGERILVADDNDVGRHLMSRLLGMRGAEVVEARDGFEVMEALSRNSFSLLLLDVQMPGMSGIDVVRRIRGEGNTIPVVAMTAHALPSERQRFLEEGMNDCLIKPISDQQLDAILADWLPQQALENANS